MEKYKRDLKIKVQINMLKNIHNYFFTQCDDFGEYVVIIQNGCAAYFLDKKELVVDISAFKQAKSGLEKEKLLDKTEPAKRTNKLILLDSGKIAVRFLSESGKEVYCDTSLLKPFGGEYRYRISGSREPIVITKNHDVVAVVMPFNISKKVLEEE